MPWQAENLRLIGALKEKLKVEKSYATGLKGVGAAARPKGAKSFLPMDELLGDQTEVIDGGYNHDAKHASTAYGGGRTII